VILNLTVAEINALAGGVVPPSVRRKAAGPDKPRLPIAGQLTVDEVLELMHAPTEEEAHAAYERRRHTR
jgi:hypothetical protein